MWTYEEARNRKTNPWYTSSSGSRLSFDGPEITSSTVFDEVRITCNPEADNVDEVHVYNAGEVVAQVGGNKGKGSGRVYTYRDDEPEVIEIRRRITAGTCVRTYYDRNDHPVPEDKDFHSAHWLMELRHPFHTDSRHLFFEHFTRDLGYVPRTLNGEQVFQLPGIWQDRDPGYRTIRVHKRGTGLPVPKVPYEGDYMAMVDAFAEEGWTVPIPAGHGPLQMFTQYYGTMTDGVPWWDPALVLPLLGITVSPENRVRQLAATFRAWEATLTAADTASSYSTAKLWWKTWLGYAWEIVNDPTEQALRVFNVDGPPRTQRIVDGRDAVLEWVIGHMETWANLGVDVFHSTHQSAVIGSTMSEPSLAHVAADGSVGEILVGLIDENVWTRYEGPSYRAAASIVAQVTANAGPDKEVISEGGATVVLDGSATVVDGYGDTTYQWELEGEGTLSDANIARPTFDPPSIIPERDNKLTIARLTVTNDGVSDTDETQVTSIAQRTLVFVAAGPDRTVTVNDSIVIDARIIIRNSHGANTYLWTLVSGGGLLDDYTILKPTFTAPDTPGTTVLRIQGTNNGISDESEVVITIEAADEE